MYKSILLYVRFINAAKYTFKNSEIHVFKNYSTFIIYFIVIIRNKTQQVIKLYTVIKL